MILILKLFIFIRKLFECKENTTNYSNYKSEQDENVKQLKAVIQFQDVK